MTNTKHVIHEISRVSEDHTEAIKAFPTATISEAYGGKGAVFHGIKAIRQGMRICGPAVPVKAPPGDNLIVHKAIYVARPGDVLVVATSRMYRPRKLRPKAVFIAWLPPPPSLNSRIGPSAPEG